MPVITGSMEDREQIRELYARYALTIDEGRFEDWVNCFTADGVFESPLFGTHAGHEALRKFCASYKESWGGAQVRHIIANVSIDIEGDRGRGICNLIYLPIEGGHPELVLVGGYRDELRKVAGNWLFAHRKVWVDK